MPSSVTRFKNLIHSRSRKKHRLAYASGRPELRVDLSFTAASERFPSRDDLYAYLHRYYFDFLPQPLRLHREYFATQGRGFGEEAFHAMWYLLLREFAPRNCLEIGVFRGQVISLWALIAKMTAADMHIKCISPFSPSADQVSKYPDLNYLEDVLQNFRHFDLPPPGYLRALSTDAGAFAYMQAEPLDCVYIDGSHDYEVVLSDYRHSVAALKGGGLLVMDDSSLDTDFSPPPFSFAGHPGPSKVAREVAALELTFLGGVGHQNVYRKPSA